MLIDLRKYPKVLPVLKGEYNIKSNMEMVHFLAQIHHESAGLTRLRESLNYTPEGLTSGFGSHRITAAQARNLGRKTGRAANQVAIANILYGGNWGLRNLGNREVGDGWKYRGAGPMQCTGRSNFARFNNELKRLCIDVDVVTHPEILASDINLGLLHAGYYWKTNGISYVAQLEWNTVLPNDDTVGQWITRKINGGNSKIKERYRLYNQYLQSIDRYEYF